MNPEAPVKLGDEVTDTITGFVGFATHKLEYFDGYVEIGVTPRSAKGNNQPGPEYIPSYRLKPTGNVISAPPKRNIMGFHGPSKKEQ